jgi:sec-independent protein translocase protein TatB
VFDIAPSEFLLVIVVALVVIGPKDLPRVMRMIGHWVGRARAMTRHFRSGIDTMMREAELDEMQRQWAVENERIMREHPSPSPVRSLLDDGYETGLSAEEAEEVAAARPLPAPHPPEEAAVETAADVEPDAEPARRLRRGSDFEDGSVP